MRFYKFRNFDAIFDDNSAMNCITLQRKNVSFPLTVTGHVYYATVHQIEMQQRVDTRVTVSRSLRCVQVPGFI